MSSPYIRRCFLVSLTLAQAGMAQECRVFLQKAGVSPIGVPLEGLTIVAEGGQSLTFDAYVECVPVEIRVVGTGLSLLCAAEGGDAGSIDFSGSITQDQERNDYLFWGTRCDEGANISRYCLNDMDCFNPDPGLSNDCVALSDNFTTDIPDCINFTTVRAGTEAQFPMPGIGTYVSVPRYAFSWTYDVSTDAQGVFTLNPTEIATLVFGPNFSVISTQSSGVTIVVPTAQCCDGMTCLGDQTRYSCSSSAAFWNPNRTCADSCGCSSYAQCDDDNVCTYESCGSGTCHGLASNRYGDTNGNNIAADIDDLLCVLAGFSNLDNCPNGDLSPSCAGDDVINLDDILKIVAAFSGADPCGCN